MREEELRSRLQALALAGQVAPEPAIGAVRRRGRRKVQRGTALAVVGLLAVVGGVRLVSEVGDRQRLGPVPPISQPLGPPAAVAPATFVGQVGDAGTRRTVIIDARTGGIEREVPGTDRRTEWVTDAVVAPDLRSMYLPSAAAARPCDAGWTQVDLTTGVRRPAFGGLADVGEFSLSADGRTLAYVDCRSGLVVRDLPTGQERVWTVPPGASVRGPQLSPDGTRLVYQLERGPGADRLLHLLPTDGTTSVTDGYDLPVAGDCPLSMWRFLDDRRLLALGCATEPFDNLLVRIDLETRQVASADRLGLPVEIFSLDVDRSGRHVLIAAAGKPDDQEPATVYLLRDGHPRRVPFTGNSWQADW
jgi:WD40-like Beta Propeller Repeat